MDTSPYREKAINEYGKRCKICESTMDIEVHHIDGNNDNNDLGNLLVVCSQCHAKIHSPKRHGQPFDRYTNHLPASSLLGGTPGKDDLTVRSVAIREDQHEWVNKTNTNLSAFVREQIDLLRDS